MIFEKGGEYRHDSTLDVDIRVYKVVPGSTYTRLYIEWLNRVGRWVVEYDEIRVKHRDLHLWRRVK